MKMVVMIMIECMGKYFNIGVGMFGIFYYFGSCVFIIDGDN